MRPYPPLFGEERTEEFEFAWWSYFFFGFFLGGGMGVDQHLERDFDEFFFIFDIWVEEICDPAPGWNEDLDRGSSSGVMGRRVYMYTCLKHGCLRSHCN